MPSTRTTPDGGVEVYKHFTGIPRSVIDAVATTKREGRARGERTKNGDIVRDAMVALIDAAERGEPITYLAQMTPNGGKSFHLWLEEGLVERFEAFCRRVERYESTVLITAVERFLAQRDAAL